MKIRIISTFFVLFYIFSAFAAKADEHPVANTANGTENPETLPAQTGMDESLLEIVPYSEPANYTDETDTTSNDLATSTEMQDIYFETDSIQPDSLIYQRPLFEIEIPVFNSRGEFSLQTIFDGQAYPERYIPNNEIIELDQKIYEDNPLFRELIYIDEPINIQWKKWNKKNYLFYGEEQHTLYNPIERIEVPHPEKILRDTRKYALDHITQNFPGLYISTIDQLPTLEWNNYEVIEGKPIKTLNMESGHVPVTAIDRDIIRKKKISPWSNKMHGLLQFSQIGVTENWHQGGNNYTAILGSIEGYFNYDNKKKIKWENSFRWRIGTNSVPADTANLRNFMINDDVIKITSKYGVKATGNFYYSTSVEAETQLFTNYKDPKSDVIKAKFLTPFRFNIGVGMDYKYKELLSVALSPISFNYIYVNDSVNVDPNQFGIEKGENELKQVGSKLIVQLKSYKPISNLKIDSKFNFFTNYESVQIDWEIVAELTFNRFFSTRLMLNPRYDTSVILENNEKAKIQMKEMLTLGFSYRFL